jgi:hypothetical protein
MWHAELMADHGKQQSSVGMVAQGAGPAIATRTEQLPPGPSPKETLDGTGRDRTAMRIADVVFAVAVAATFVLYFVKSRGVVLNGDDWATVPRGNTFVDYFRPYQQNLSIVPIAVYHFVFTVFGFGTYWPLRFAGIASLMAIVVTVFLIVRSRWGSAVALVVGVALLW